MGRQNENKLPAKVPNPEDGLQAAATDAAAKAVIRRLALVCGPNKSKQIRALTKTDARLLAGDAITAWVLERARQARENPDIFDELVKDPQAPLDDPIDDLFR